MERQIETIREIAGQQRELPVWEKFENHEEEHSKLKMEPPPKMSGVSTIWLTQNMEYGRFQLANRGFPAQNAAPENSQQEVSPQAIGSRPQSEGAQSYLSDKIEPENPQEENNNCDPQETERAMTGVQNLPPVDLKYMAASRRGNRPMETGSNRLTTGYAKQWMSSEHGRFWNNIQEVAPVAGYDVSAKLPPAPAESNAEVLKVE